MRKIFLSFLSSLAEENIFVSTSLNRLWCLYHIFDFKKLYSDKNVSYQNLEIEIENKKPLINDDRTNFIVRVALEFKYKKIIEIGGYDLARPLHYKRLFPEVEVWALDITKNFPIGLYDGIHTDRFNLNWFSSNSQPNSLITCSGTLSYFKPIELQNFLEKVYKLKFDLAIVELGSHFSKTRSLKRGVISYYHPYETILTKIGFDVNLIHPNHAFSLNSMERREYILATS